MKKEQIINILEEYIKVKSWSGNVAECIKQIEYDEFYNFFNDITVLCLGQPPKRFEHNKDKSRINALIYLPNSSINVQISNVYDILITKFYMGILTQIVDEFNYPNYKEFIETLYKIKHDPYISDDIKILVNTYMNSLYGMINADKSFVNCNIVNIRREIVEHGKNIIIKISEFLIENNIPIYYIDTDTIIVEKFDKNKLIEFFDKNFDTILNKNISDLYIENIENILFLAKKKYIKNYTGISRFIRDVNNKYVIEHNKKFFNLYN